MTEPEYYQVVTTTDSREAADSLARAAVEARVAACSQVVGPIDSTYWWEGKLSTAQEWQVIFKTPTDRYAALEDNIRSHHSYEVPEILGTAVAAGNPAYLEWLTAETRDTGADQTT